MEGGCLKRAFLKTLNLSGIPVRLCADLCEWLGGGSGGLASGSDPGCTISKPGVFFVLFSSFCQFSLPSVKRIGGGNRPFLLPYCSERRGRINYPSESNNTAKS